MKKLLLIIGMSSSFISLFAQTKFGKIEDVNFINRKVEKHKQMSSQKNLNCFDTLRYAEAKEQVLSTTPNYYYQELWRSDNEEISMAYMTNFSNLIHGVEFLARKNASASPTSIVVQASIYSANQSFEPNTLIGSATINITNSTSFEYYIINFPVPLVVNGNYCVVIKPITTNGVIDITVNDVAVSSHDEMFCRFKSDYFASSSGQWIAIPSFSEFVVQPANFEPLVAPIVSYPLQTQIIYSDQIICKNEELSLNSQISPSGIYGNRFYNWYSFLSHFNNGTIDSTIYWNTPNSLINNSTYGPQTSVKYNNVSQYNISLTNNFGFYSSCLDQDTMIVTINQPNTNAGNDIVTCEGESITLTASGANSYNWNNNVSNGITFTPITSGLYIVEGTSQYGCTKNDTVSVTLNTSTSSVINLSNLDSLSVNGITYYQTGTYYQTLTNTNGCDSLITINATVDYAGINNINFNKVNIKPLYYLDLNGRIISPLKNTLMFAVLENGEIIKVYEFE